MSNAAIAIIILVCMLASFIWNKVPVELTAILGALAMAYFGVLPFSEALVHFGSDTVLMVAGVMVIGNALFETGCAQMLGSALVRIPGVGTNEKIFLTAVILVVTVLSAFVSNTATVAMMLPLIASLAIASHGKITKKNTYMAVGIASIVGGNATLAGSTPQIVAQGVLEQTSGVRTMTFFELTRGTIPIVIVMLLYFVTVGYRLQTKVFSFPDVPDNAGDAGQPEQYSRGKMVCSAVIFLGCVIAFVSGVATFGVISITGACLCCLTGCISIQKVWSSMDWRTVAVLGGTLGVAAGMEQSGALQMIADTVLRLLGGAQTSIWQITAVIIIICAFLGNVMSHTATAAIMTPFAIAIAQGMGQDPIPYVIMVILGCNLAFATPMSTPPLTMVLVGGYRFTDYLKVGGLFNIIAVITAIITIPFLYGLV